MLNPYQPITAKIVEIQDKTPNVRLFELQPSVKFNFQPGQIILAGQTGFGEAPFAICSNPENKNIEICVRKAGRLTNKLHELKKKDTIQIRGPYGNGWPINKDKNLLLVVGGLGLIPLRSLILNKDKILGKNNKIQIFYGTKHPNEFLFKDEFDTWRKNGIDLQLTIDKSCPEWNGCVGTVTVLFDKTPLVDNAQTFLCGPPIMFKFVIQKLKDKNFPTRDIYMSLERRMHCGLGICQHCAIGPKYVCKDGPVFSYEELREIPDVF